MLLFIDSIYNELRHRRRAIAAYRLAAWHRQKPVKPKVLTHPGYLSLTHTRASAPPCGSEARFFFISVIPRWLFGFAQVRLRSE